MTDCAVQVPRLRSVRQGQDQQLRRPCARYTNFAFLLRLYLTLVAGYTQSLRPGLKASFGLALDTQKLNEVDPAGHVHKVRFAYRVKYCALTAGPGWDELCV
jgi:hypothetical protein